jgi:hypothetical protein
VPNEFDEHRGVPGKFMPEDESSLTLSEPTDDSASNSSPDRAYPSPSGDSVWSNNCVKRVATLLAGLRPWL